MRDESLLPEKMESPKTRSVEKESIGAFPVEVFLQRLTYQHGWDVSVRDRVRIARVLRADGAWTTARLQQVLGSLLARSPDEHQVFESHFRAFFGPPTVAEPLQVLPWDRDRLRADLERLGEPVAPASQPFPPSFLRVARAERLAQPVAPAETHLRDEPFWDGATLRAVRLRMSVFPASAEGLVRMSQAFFTEQGRSVTRRRLPSPVDPHASLEARLREILDTALPWAQTCSCLPSIPAGLADALRRRFHSEIPAAAIGRLYALLDRPGDTAGLQLSEPVRTALFAGFCASRSDEQRAEVFAFLRGLIDAKVCEVASGSLARQSGEALLMRLRLFEGGVPQIEVVGRLLGSHLGPAFRVGLGEDARLLRDAQRLSAEQTDTLQRRGLLPKVRVPYPPDMVRIPAGRFWMGDPTHEGLEDERPRHEVEVGEFFIGKYPVTWRLWREVRDWAVERGYPFDNQGRGRGDDHPVTDVNWDDAVKWCNARSEREKRRPAYYTDASRTEIYKQGRLDLPSEAVDWTADGYRLPTEAEWEKAARGGLDGQHYPWESCGKGYERFISPERANYDASQRGGIPTVETYKPNYYGLYDMAGNVWQWTWDRWKEYSESTEPLFDSRGRDSGALRVDRGGGWWFSARSLRCAYRSYWHPSDARGSQGFRLAGGQADAGFAELDEGGERTEAGRKIGAGT